MKKRAYNRVDTSKFTRKQMAAYKRRLAAVRKYTQAKRKREKEMRASGVSASQVSQMKQRVKFFRAQNIDVSKMERLIAELQRAVDREKERQQDQERIAQVFEELEVA